MSVTNEKPLPIIFHLTRPFWEGTRQHELVIQKCKKCSSYLFPPTPMCRICGSVELQWVRTSGEGIIYSYAIIHQDLNRGFKNEVPYVLALIELKEGFRVYSRVMNSREEVTIGSRVSVIFEEMTPEITIYKFRIDSNSNPLAELK